MKTPMQTDMSTLSSTSFGSGVDPAERSVQSTDPIDETAQILSDLASRPRMPARGEDAVEGNSLVLDANLSPRWGTGGLSAGTVAGQIAFWDDTLLKWVVSAAPASDYDLYYWNASDESIDVLAAPTVDGQCLTREDGIVSWGYLKFHS